jgi:hypothetical protein
MSRSRTRGRRGITAFLDRRNRRRQPKEDIVNLVSNSTEERTTIVLNSWVFEVIALLK